MDGDKWSPMLSIKEHCSAVQPSAEWVLHGKENYRSVRKMNEVEVLVGGEKGKTVVATAWLKPPLFSLCIMGHIGG